MNDDDDDPYAPSRAELDYLRRESARRIRFLVILILAVLGSFFLGLGLRGLLL